MAFAVAVAATSAQAAVQISSSPTQNMSCAGSVCTPTAKSAVLNATDLANMLATSDVKVVTGSGAVTIGIISPLTWASTQRLTLDANQSVRIKARVVVEGTAGLTIITNDGGTGGDLMFYSGGKVDFWDVNSSLIINGNSYALMHDIQGLANGIAADPFGFFALSRDYDAAPDGNYRGPAIPVFDGEFEGLGHTIANFTSNSNAYVAGLFYEVGSEDQLRDIRMTNVKMTNRNNTLSQNSVGALVAVNLGAVFNASSDGNIVAGKNSAVGGLIGLFDLGTISRSFSTARVTGAGHGSAGGLVGAIRGGGIVDARASGDVTTGSHGTAGGLVGFADSRESSTSIVRSFATGNVIGQVEEKRTRVGGLVGEAEYDVQVIDSYATGSVTAGAGTNLGGLLGWARIDAVHTSYSVGNVNPNGNAHVGGFAGLTTVQDMIDDYWDIDPSGQTKACPRKSSCNGVTGLSDAELKSQLPLGFDPAIWGQNPSINNGYPYLLANPPQ